MNRKGLLGIAALVVACGLGSWVVGQSEKQPPSMPPGMEKMPAEEMKKMMEWMKYSTPAEQHEWLKYFAGEWTCETKCFTAGPDAPPTTSGGTVKSHMILGGRFVQEEHQGNMMGMPFEGIGITGYDRIHNVYTGFWIDSMGTQMYTFEGSSDPAGKVMTLYGRMDEPGIKVIGRMVKFKITIINDDTYMSEMIDLNGSAETKVMEMTYKRKKMTAAN